MTHGAPAWGLEPPGSPVGRRRRPQPGSVVHLVFVDGTEARLPTGSPLANAIGQVAALLAGDPIR